MRAKTATLGSRGLMSAFLVLTLSVVFFNLLADLVYFKLDPRITS